MQWKGCGERGTYRREELGGKEVRKTIVRVGEEGNSEREERICTMVEREDEGIG